MTIASSYATLAARGVYCEPSPDHLDHHPGRQADRDPAAAVQPGDPRRSPTASTNCSKARSRTAPPRDRGTGADRPPERRARPTITTSPGSSGTPQLSTAVWIGNVIPADEQTRRAYTSTESVSASTGARAMSSVARSPHPSGARSWPKPVRVCRSSTSPTPARPWSTANR